ncbi:hypothetical protein IQ235_11275 [Oscillatoriales cyanobacterium LEGE 11467]|uniref:Uncharacterized protein n=1 Tax=Zarconia navalis LEGE 11467 TaxID=1828826 RepID=A0A928Z7E4_9CYAN|nr:hypothetical protein [Zarconia navalis]MBE9041362.1 hypothetical protein [Zarconia navalis LEGE 11467]
MNNLRHNPSSRKSAIALLVAVGILPLLLPKASIAQEYEDDAIQPLDLQQDITQPESSEVDSFLGETGGGLNIYEILNRANLARDRSVSDVVGAQEENLLDAASDFRTRQLELIRQQRLTEENPEAADSGGTNAAESEE